MVLRGVESTISTQTFRKKKQRKKKIARQDINARKKLPADTCAYLHTAVDWEPDRRNYIISLEGQPELPRSFSFYESQRKRVGEGGADWRKRRQISQKELKDKDWRGKVSSSSTILSASEEFFIFVLTVSLLRILPANHSHYWIMSESREERTGEKRRGKQSRPVHVQYRVLPPEAAAAAVEWLISVKWCFSSWRRSETKLPSSGLGAQLCINSEPS